MRRLFEEIEERENAECRVTCSYIQIYQEKIYDLLNPNKRALKLRWSKEQDFQVENLFSIECLSSEELLAQYLAGGRHREIGSTGANETSSRSHCIFTVRVETRESDSSVIG